MDILKTNQDKNHGDHEKMKFGIYLGDVSKAQK